MEESTNSTNDSFKIDLEKIVVYASLLAMFMTIILYLFSLKDEICSVKERLITVEQKLWPKQ